MMTTSAAVGIRTAAPPDPPPAAPRRWAAASKRLLGWVQNVIRRDPVLVTVLVASFLARWLLSGKESYWLDELYSVATYGIWNESAAAAVNHLGSASVHPPLYQFVLYYWMDLFGDGERATRSLSNLYITLATLLLYLLVRAAFTRRLALASAIIFTLMYSPTYYGMETRSYAQTIFLVTLSSYTLLWIMRTGTTRGWGQALRSPAAAVFMAANVGLLLTHYYNAFVWVAQGILAGIFVLRERPIRSWAAGLGVLAAGYAIQGGLFALVWGSVLVDDFRRRGGAFPTDGGVRSPLHLLDSIAAMNLYYTVPAAVLRWAGLAGLVAMVLVVVIALGRRQRSTAERQQTWTASYLLGWLLIPLLVAYATFLITGVARYSTRYWLFILPPLAPLLALALEAAVRRIGQVWRQPRTAAAGTVVLAVVIATLVLPGTVTAAERTKSDFRGTARNIVEIIESNPESSFLIYPASVRPAPVLDYYLNRFSEDVQVTAAILLSEEEQGGDFGFERTADLIAASDFLIVTFTHRPIDDFPTAVARLTATYDVHYWQIDGGGHGMVTFAVSETD